MRRKEKCAVVRKKAGRHGGRHGGGGGGGENTKSVHRDLTAVLASS